MNRTRSFKANSETETISLEVDGVPVGVRRLSGKVIKQLNGYSLIEQDLKFAQILIKNFNNISEKDRDTEFGRAIFHSAVMAYAKCFASTDGRGIKLEADILRDYPYEILNTHKGIINIRNQYIAHAGDNSGFEQAQTVVLIAKDRSNPRYFGVACFPLQMVSTHDEEIKNFLELTNILSEKVTQITRRLFDKIKTLVDEVKLEDLYNTKKEVVLEHGLLIEKN